MDVISAWVTFDRHKMWCHLTASRSRKPENYEHNPDRWQHYFAWYNTRNCDTCTNTPAGKKKTNFMFTMTWVDVEYLAGRRLCVPELFLQVFIHVYRNWNTKYVIVLWHFAIHVLSLTQLLKQACFYISLVTKQQPKWF